MQSLSALTGLEVRAPMGLATGSFQNSESYMNNNRLTSRNVCPESS